MIMKKLDSLKNIQNELELCKDAKIETTEVFIKNIKVPKSFKIDDFVEFECN